MDGKQETACQSRATGTWAATAIVACLLPGARALAAAEREVACMLGLVHPA